MLAPWMEAARVPIAPSPGASVLARAVITVGFNKILDGLGRW